LESSIAKGYANSNNQLFHKLLEGKIMRNDQNQQNDDHFRTEISSKSLNMLTKINLIHCFHRRDGANNVLEVLATERAPPQVNVIRSEGPALTMGQMIQSYGVVI